MTMKGIHGCMVTEKSGKIGDKFCLSIGSKLYWSVFKCTFSLRTRCAFLLKSVKLVPKRKILTKLSEKVNDLGNVFVLALVSNLIKCLKKRIFFTLNMPNMLKMVKFRAKNLRSNAEYCKKYLGNILTYNSREQCD